MGTLTLTYKEAGESEPTVTSEKEAAVAPITQEEGNGRWSFHCRDLDNFVPLITIRHDDRWVWLSSGSPTATEWPCLPPVWREIDKRGPQTSPSQEASGFSLLHSPSSVLLVLQVTHLMCSPPRPCLDPGFLPSPNFCLFRTAQHSLCVRGPEHRAAGVSGEERTRVEELMGTSSPSRPTL